MLCAGVVHPHCVNLLRKPFGFLFLLPYMEKRYFLEEVKALFADSYYYADIADHSMGFS